MEDIVVGIGDVKIAKGEVPLVTYALGSCVGVCIYDEAIGLGGMLHAMLPTVTNPDMIIETERYVDIGLAKLFDTLCRMGAARERMKAKLIGGAKMFEYSTFMHESDIGTLNVRKAKETLQRLGILLVCEVTGGEVGRTIRFVPANGAVEIHSTDGTTELI